MKTGLTNLILSGLKLLYNTVKPSSSLATQSRAFFSTNSQPEVRRALPKKNSFFFAPVKVYENVHTQKREILEENRGKGCVYM